MGKKNETYQRLGSIQNAWHGANFHQPRTHLYLSIWQNSFFVKGKL